MASTQEALAHAALEWQTPLFRTALAQFDEAVPYAGIAEDTAERLRYPERSLIVSCPVRMDDGRRVVFPGYRVQHSSVARADEGRHPLRRGGHARRVRCARGLDDVEVRAAAPSLRRREGRRALQPARALARASSSG